MAPMAQKRGVPWGSHGSKLPAKPRVSPIWRHGCFPFGWVLQGVLTGFLLLVHHGVVANRGGPPFEFTNQNHAQKGDLKIKTPK